MRNHLFNSHCTDCPSRLNSVFCNIDNPSVELLEAGKNTEFYKAGTTIFHEGAHPGGLYIIQQGKVKIFKNAGQKREQIVRLIKKGDIFGYRSLIGDENYTASAATLEDTHVCYIPKVVFTHLIRSNPSVYENVIQLLTSSLKLAETRMKNIAQKDLRARLAESIILLYSMFASEEEKYVIDLKLSREELASFVGTATVCVIRILTDFREEGILEFQDKKIRILQYEALFKIAQIFD